MISAGFSPTNRQLVQFAWAAPVGFTLIGWAVRKFGGPSWMPWAGLALGLALLAVGLARPTSIRLVYALALMIAAPIGWLVSNLFIGIFWLLMLTPLALVFRLMRRDPLDLRGRPGTTAWSPRRTHGGPASYYRQG